MAGQKNGNGARRARFVEEYLKDCNATQAAIRAGYSPKSANPQGARLLANASIQKAIAEAQAARAERVRVTVDEVVSELRRIAFGTKTADGVKVRALDLLGKHLAMFTEVRRHEIEDLPAMVVRRE